MSKLALLHKYPHWSEVLSVLSYADNSSVEFLHHKRGVTYTDPLGKTYECQIKSHFNGETDVFICNGSIHLETHPLNKGKIPYAALPFKVAIEHTTGYSPWDFLQMIDLAKISSSKSEDAQGSRVIFAINEKCYRRFMSTDWTYYGKDYYEKYKSKISDLIKKGYVIPTKIEPAQFWLENVPHTKGLEHSNNICICLNWCNMNKKSKILKIVDICKSLYKYSGKHIDIRLHSYTSSSFLKYLEELPYVNLIPYESMSKYDIMDKYDLYFVDGTGLGYEIAYRNKYKGRNVNIFYLSGLPSDESMEGFDGIVEMKATPCFDQNDFINGIDKSNFPPRVIEESFPHTPGNVPNECYKILTDLSEKVKNLK